MSSLTPTPGTPQPTGHTQGHQNQDIFDTNEEISQEAINKFAKLLLDKDANESNLATNQIEKPVHVRKPRATKKKAKKKEAKERGEVDDLRKKLGTSTDGEQKLDAIPDNFATVDLTDTVKQNIVILNQIAGKYDKKNGEKANQVEPDDAPESTDTPESGSVDPTEFATTMINENEAPITEVAIDGTDNTEEIRAQGRGKVRPTILPKTSTQENSGDSSQRPEYIIRMNTIIGKAWDRHEKKVKDELIDQKEMQELFKLAEKKLPSFMNQWGGTIKIQKTDKNGNTFVIDQVSPTKQIVEWIRVELLKKEEKAKSEAKRALFAKKLAAEKAAKAEPAQPKTEPAKAKPVPAAKPVEPKPAPAAPKAAEPKPAAKPVEPKPAPAAPKAAEPKPAAKPVEPTTVEPTKPQPKTPAPAPKKSAPKVTFGQRVRNFFRSILRGLVWLITFGQVILWKPKNPKKA